MFWTTNIFELWPQNCLSGSFVILSCASCWCRSKVLIDRQVGKLERFFIMEWLSVFQRFWHCFVRNYYRLTTRLSVKSFLAGPAQARELLTQVYFTSLQQFWWAVVWMKKKSSNLSDPTWTYPNWSQHIQTDLNLSQQIWTYPNISQPLQTYLNLSEPI